MRPTIPFNQPHLTGQEMKHIQEAVTHKKLSGNGPISQRCQSLLEQRYGFNKVLLTTSCTDALEMAALLLDIRPGDEVIMPSYTFVSTANAFVLRGARIVFCDSRQDHPGMDEQAIETLVTPHTKAIVVVHYAGVACDMDLVMAVAERHGLKVVEDAAQAIGATYKGRPLGGIGHLGAYSFHETKNVQCGEGGALLVNDASLAGRAEIIWEKGTNRTAFYRGEVDKYGWVDVGSSFLPSEVTAAFLFAQLETLDHIQATRKRNWERYRPGLAPLAAEGRFRLPVIPEHSSNNHHIFYLLCPSEAVRDGLIEHLRKEGISAVFHYVPLHLSRFYKDKHDGRPLSQAVRYAECLVRLPLYHELSAADQDRVIDAVISYFKG